MKDLDKDIEQKLKEQFNKQDFDIQEAWLEDMSSKLDNHNKKDRKKFFFWLFAGAFILCGAAATLCLNADVEENKNSSYTLEENNTRSKNVILEKKANNKLNSTAIVCDEKETINNKKITLSGLSKKSGSENNFNSKKAQKTKLSNKNSVVTVSNKVKSLAYNSNTLNKESTSKNEITTKGKIQKPNTTVNSNNINLTKEEATLNTLLNTSGQKQNSKTITYSETKSFANKEKVSNTVISNNQNLAKEEDLKKVSNKTSSTTILNELNSKKENLTLVESKEEINSSTEDKKLITSVNNKEEANKSLVLETVKEDSLKEALTLLEKEDSILKTPENKTKQIDKENSKKETGLSLNLNAGPSILFRNFKTDTQNEKRLKEETNKIAWNLNLELFKTFKNNIILGTGVNITNYGEKIDYTTINEINKVSSSETKAFNYFDLKINKFGSTISYDTSAIIYYDTVTVISDSIYENASVQKANGSTNFTYIEIPILFGYQILNTKKWSLNATTGISTGFLISSKGNYISTENQLESATNNKVIFNYLLSAQLNYKVFKNLSLSIAPNFKYNLNNLSTYAATRKKYSSIGLNAGLRFDF